MLVVGHDQVAVNTDVIMLASYDVTNEKISVIQIPRDTYFEPVSYTHLDVYKRQEYVPASPRAYKSKAGAQDAHEAIRPANPTLEPDKIKKYLTADQYKLYKLILDVYKRQESCIRQGTRSRNDRGSG